MAYAGLTAFIDALHAPTTLDLAKRLVWHDFPRENLMIVAAAGDQGRASDKAVELIAKLIDQEVKRAMGTRAE